MKIYQSVQLIIAIVNAYVNVYVIQIVICINALNVVQKININANAHVIENIYVNIQY